MIKDLNSTNGIFFKVSEIGVNLKVGMILELGSFLYKVNKARNNKLEMSLFYELEDIRKNEKAIKDDIVFDFEKNNEIIYEKSNSNYSKYFKEENPKTNDLAILTLKKKNYNMKPTQNNE